jgi:hypothetical protein
MLKRYMIERAIPGIGSQDEMELAAAAQTSNGALAKLMGIQWQHSYVAADKTFCVYLAENEDVVREHARVSGFPADRVTEICEIIDPTNERRCYEPKAVLAA